MSSPRLVRMFVSAIPFVLVACAPTEKGQTRDWEQNSVKVMNFAAKYPGFKKQLDDQLAQAKAIFEKAKSLSDEKERAQKMKDANDKIGAFLSFFESYETKLKRLDSLKSDHEIQRLPAYQVTPAIDLATRIAADARTLLEKATPDNAIAAQAKLREASELLEKALRPLEELKREIERKKDQERKRREAERKASAPAKKTP
jgi:hypothetical protein